MDAYWCAYHRKKNGSPDGDIWAAIQWAAVYTPEENALYDWLTIIAIKNWPVTSVEDPAYRWQSKHQYKISYKHIAMIAFLTGEVVEEKIDTMLVNKKAIALYDGLTRDTFHEVCLYVSWIHAEGESDERKQIALLGTSPMPAMEGADDAVENDGEADVSTCNCFHDIKFQHLDFQN